MKKLVSLMILVACAMLVVACADDEDGGTSSGNGTPCDPTTDTQTCTNDLTQVLECRYVEDSASNEWVPVKTCNVNFGEYCRQLANGTFSCRDDSSTTDTGDTTPTDTGDTSDTTPTDTGDSTPTDTGDSTPTDTGDSDPSDTGDSEPPVAGSGIKIEGTLALYHPTAIPVNASGNVDDWSSDMLACPISGSLGENSVYGTITINVNTPYIATPEEMDALQGLSDTDPFVQAQHSYSGNMGETTLPYSFQGVTFSYYDVVADSNGTDHKILYIDDMDVSSGGSLSPDHVLRIYCEIGEDGVPSGTVTIGPYTISKCSIYIMKLKTTDDGDYCYYAIGISEPQLNIGDGLTFTIQ